MKFLLMHEFDAGVKMRFSICDNGNNIFLEVINDMIYGFNLVFFGCYYLYPIHRRFCFRIIVKKKGDN